MAGMLGGLGGDVHQHPPDRPSGLLEPGRGGQLTGGIQIGQGGDQVVGPGRHLVVGGEYSGQGLARQRRSDRHVEPHRLVSLGRRWYFVAYDLVRHDWRSFRVDRATDLTGDGSRFLPRALPTADAGEFVRSGMDSLPGLYRVEAIIEATAETVHERIGRWCTTEPLDAGRCRISMTADSLDWPTMALGVVDADFRILEPPELIARVRNWAERFGRV